MDNVYSTVYALAMSKPTLPGLIALIAESSPDSVVAADPGVFALPVPRLNIAFTTCRSETPRVRSRPTTWKALW